MSIASSTTGWAAMTWAVIAVLFFTRGGLTQSIELAYCSSMNTAGTSANTSIYQSEGLCYNFCLDDYAYAILQYNECWCSNYAPGSTTSTDDCDTSCPGYQSDICGGDDLYGYLSLTKSPSGTKAASTKATSTSTEEATSIAPTTTAAPHTVAPTTVVLISTVTQSPSVAESSSTTKDDATTSTTSTKDSSSTTSTTQATTTSTTDSDTSTSATWTATPVTSVETVTGQVRTVTYTPTSPPTSVTETSSSSGHSLSTGQAVGLAIGLIGGIALIAGLVFLWWRRKRQQERTSDFGSPGRRESFATPLPSQSMSDNSRYMLGTDGRQVVEGWDNHDNQAGSRRSRLMPVDPRLDPFAPVYQRGDLSKSRESVNTLRDDHDYSRRVVNQPVLRATNPDT